MKQIITKSKIRKGDTVLVKTGKDASKQGLVEKVFIAKQMVLVKGINVVKKHMKPKGKQQPGQIISMEKPISWANTMLVCPSCSKATRVGLKLVGKTKQRVCKKCNQVIEVKKIEKKSK